MKHENFKAIAKHTSSAWCIEENRIAIIQKTYFYNGEHHYKGHWEDNPKEKFELPAVFFNEIKEYLKAEIEHYNGFELRTTPNNDAFTTLVYKNNIIKGASFATPRDSKSSIEKAKEKIDSGKYN